MGRGFVSPLAAAGLAGSNRPESADATSGRSQPHKGKELTNPTFAQVELAQRLTLSGLGLMVHVF